MVALNDANEVYDDDYDDQDLFHPSTRTRTLLTVTPRSTSPAPGHYPNLRLLSHSINTGTLTESRTFRLAGCVFGILGVFLVYGLLQEKLMTRDYGVS